jgi:penicillin amidase/acyl-homoserine-lactone acylase
MTRRLIPFRVLRALLVLLVLLASALLAASLWQQRSRISTDELLERAKAHDVQIVRDSWGVPHIFGAHDSDVAFGLGYAHSEDDYPTVPDATLATSQPPTVRPAPRPCSAT